MNLHQDQVDRLDMMADRVTMNRNQFCRTLIDQLTDADIDEIIVRRLGL